MSAPKARLFVALDLPSSARAALTRWGAQALSGQAGVRPVAAEALHVTLCFLGWREETEVGAVAELVRACAAPPVATPLMTGAPACFPPRRPRVLAVDLVDGDGALVALQARMSETLAAHADYEPEARRFRPHVTVARVARGARLRAVTPPPPPALRFAGEAVTLYRSRLGSGGARYEPVLRVALAAGAG